MIYNPTNQPSSLENAQLSVLLNSVEEGTAYLNSTLRIYDATFKLDDQGNLIDGLELISFCLNTPAFSRPENGLAVMNSVAPNNVINGGIPAMYTICNKDGIIKLLGTAGGPNSDKELKISPIGVDTTVQSVRLAKGELVKIETFSIKLKTQS